MHGHEHLLFFFVVITLTTPQTSLCFLNPSPIVRPSALLHTSPTTRTTKRAFVRMSTIEGEETAEDSITLSQIRQNEKKLRSQPDRTHFAMDALFAPSKNECPPTLISSCELPADLPGGVILRLGPNPKPDSLVSAFFDGDGMVHAVALPPAEMREKNKLWYSRTWVRTQGYTKEEEEGKPLFQGTLVAPRGWPVLAAMFNNMMKTGRVVKDTANTAISTHGGKILARMEQCLPSEIVVAKDARIRTVKAATDLDGTIPSDVMTGGSLGAHTKEDPRTGESFCVTYNTIPPSVRYDVRDPLGDLKHSDLIMLDTPVMVHDLAITPTWTVLMDLPVTLKPQRTMLDRFPLEYEGTAKARIGLIPRYGRSDDVVWAYVEPCVVLHTINAYETDNGRVVLQALRSVPPGPHSFLCEFVAAHPYEWIINPVTGVCESERYLSRTPSEFPTINPTYVGRKAKYFYGISPSSVGGPITVYTAPRESVLYRSVVKYNLKDGSVCDRFDLSKDTYIVSENTVVPKKKTTSSSVQEDDCYLLVWVSQVEGYTGERREKGGSLLIFDAADIKSGPVSTVPLPADLPYGLHSAWVPWEMLEDAEKH